MIKIEDISTEELEKDLRESLLDIKACEAGLIVGLVESGGISIQYRLDQNKHFVKVINAELERRRKKSENAAEDSLRTLGNFPDPRADSLENGVIYVDVSSEERKIE